MMTNSIQTNYPGANASALRVLAAAPFAGRRPAAGTSPSQDRQVVAGRALWRGEGLEGKPSGDCPRGQFLNHQI
jgi:hypothetical protein